jgi:hypothetical protein
MSKTKNGVRPSVIPDEVSAPRRESYPGLCEMCAVAPDCTFPRDVHRPVTSCEEFQGVRPPKAKFRLPVVRPTNPSPYRGLCATCARVADCTFPKPDGGVWHCDEFA